MAARLCICSTATGEAVWWGGGRGMGAGGGARLQSSQLRQSARDGLSGSEQSSLVANHSMSS